MARPLSRLVLLVWDCCAAVKRRLGMGERHFYLLDHYHEGRPVQEPVHAIHLGGGRFRLLHSPGMVGGIAAGDEFRFVGRNGAFQVIHRSGNLAVQVYSRELIAPIVAEVSRRVADLGGVLDGQIPKGMVFTIPVEAGFPPIEKLFTDLVATHPNLTWCYGNVYDPADEVTPLNWWHELESPQADDPGARRSP